MRRLSDRVIGLFAGLRRPISAFFALGLFWGAWSALLPSVTHALQLSDGQIGFALTCAMLGAMPAMLLAGRAANRPGAPLLGIVVAVFGLTCLLPAVAPDLPLLAVSLALVGAASATLDVMMNAAVSQIEAAQGHQRMHLAHAAYSAGLFAASVSAGLLRQAGIDYRAIVVLVACVIVLLSCLARSANAARPAPRGGAGTQRAASKMVLSAPLIALGILCAVALVLENGMELWSALHLMRTLGASAAIAGLGPGMLALAACIGRLSGQSVVARIGDARLMAWSGMLTAVGVVAFALAPAWQFALPALLVSGAGVSIVVPTIVGAVGRAADARQRGSAVSAVSLIGYGGFLVGPAGLGYLSDSLGLPRALLSLSFCAAAVALVGPPLIRWLRRRSHRPI